MSLPPLFPTIMRAFGILSAVLFAAIATVNAAEPPEELVVETTYAPPECPAKAQSGDKVKVHYVRYPSVVPPLCILTDFAHQTGTLFSDGSKFDSRCVHKAHLCSYTQLSASQL